MNSTEIKDHFRLEVSDTELPQLWSDEELFVWLNDAYSMFVRFTGGIPDFTSEACEVAVSEGESRVDLHPSILRIMQASRRSDGREIDILNATDTSRMSPSDYGRLKPLLMDPSVGEVKVLVIGMQRNVGRVIHVPLADDTLDLVIYRLPLTPITGEGQELVDVEPMHHFHLIKWMKALAYRKQDAETFDPTAASDNEALFRLYCTEVKSENERYKHKTRVVAYGGV